MDALAATLTKHEQLAFVKLTVLVADATQQNNLATFVSFDGVLGAIAIVAAGAASPGSKMFSSSVSVYINGVITSVKVCRLPVS